MNNQLLIPCEKHASILEIDFKALFPHANFIIDVDNTLVQRNTQYIDENIVSYIKNLKQQGIIEDICLVSNIIAPTSKRIKRVSTVAEQLNAHYLYAYGWHMKPHRHFFQLAMERMHSTPRTTVVIGDQIYTDIRGGNALGIYTIWVQPLGSDAWFTKYHRWLEKRINP